MTLCRGDTVLIVSAKYITTGKVVEVMDARNMPNFGTPRQGEQVEEILREWEISEVAMIEHSYDDETPETAMVFAALKTKTGTWYDLKRQELSITPIRAALIKHRPGGPVN